MLEYAPNIIAIPHAARQGSNLNSNTHLLPLLRRHTQEAHAALEAQPLVRGLLDPALSLGHYAQLLRAFAAFYRRLEPRLSLALDDWHNRFPSTYRYQPRLPLLQADLADLGIGQSQDKTDPSVPLTVSVATVPGMLYVLEGATQGGRVIAPKLQQSLGVSERFGARYFNLHRRLDSWSHFREWISHTEPQLDQSATLTGALTTFTGLHAHLDHWQVDLSDC